MQLLCYSYRAWILECQIRWETKIGKTFFKGNISPQKQKGKMDIIDTNKIKLIFRTMKMFLIVAFIPNI